MHIPEAWLAKALENKKGYFDRLRKNIEEYEMSLDPIDPDKAILRIHGNGRLAELVKHEGDDYEPLIIWFDETRLGSKPYNMMFRRENGQWIRTR